MASLFHGGFGMHRVLHYLFTETNQKKQNALVVNMGGAPPPPPPNYMIKRDFDALYSGKINSKLSQTLQASKTPNQSFDSIALN